MPDKQILEVPIVAKFFIDSNILVYTLDKKVEEKNRISRDVLRYLTLEHTTVLSTQVLQEFYSATTSKLKIDKILVKNLVHSYSNLEIVTVQFPTIEQAIDISIVYQLSFWDSLIIAAAEHARCDFLVSEDLNNGQTVRGIQVINPFKVDITKL